MGKKTFYAAIFFLPWANLSLVGNFLLSDLLIIISFFIMLPKLKKIDKYDYKILSLIYLFLISLFISSFNSLNFAETINGIFQYLFIFIIFYISLINYLREKEDIQTALLFFYISMSVINIYTIIMYLLDPTSVLSHNDRLQSFYSSAWVFALYEMVFLSVIYYFFYVRNRLVKIINLSMFILTVFLLILSGARSAIITLLLFILILGYFRIAKINISRWIKFTLIILYTSLILLCSIIYEKIILHISLLISTISPVTSLKLMSLLSDNIDDTRTSIYMSGIEYLLQNPLNGIGPGNFSHYYGVSMHNYFLAHWLENGLLALIVIVVMYLYIYLNTIKINDRLSQFILILNSTFLFFMMFNPILLSRFFWFPLLISLAIIKISRKAKNT